MRPPGSPRRRGSWQARIHLSRGGAPPASATTEAGITRSHPEPGSSARLRREYCSARLREGRASRSRRALFYMLRSDAGPRRAGRRPPLPGRARGAPRAARAEKARGGGTPLRASLCFGRHWSARRRDRCRGPSIWPADCVGTSHAPKSHRGESSLWDFLRFEVEKRLLDVWLFSVRVLWSHAGSRFRLLPNCV